MRPAAIVFDLDGTLVDSLRDLSASVNEVLSALQRPTREDYEIRSMIGHGVAHLLGEALGDVPELLPKARELFRGIYEARLLATTRCYPGLPEVLRQLAQRVPLAIATNKPSAFTSKIVAGLNLEALGLSAWASADEVPARKPDPAVLRLACERLGGPLGPIGYVGDMPVDIATARNFGGIAVGVAWGFDPAGTRAANPDLWLNQPSDLLRLLD